MELIKNYSNVSKNSRCSDHDKDRDKIDSNLICRGDKDKMKNNSKLMVN